MLKVHPHSGHIVLRQVEAKRNQSSFRRHSTYVFVDPPTLSDSSAQVNEPTEKCLCPPIPARVSPEVADASTQCNIELDDTTELSRLRQGFNEAKAEAFTAFEALCAEVATTKELTAEVESLTAKVVSLTARVHTLNEENEALLKRTFDLSEQVTSLTAITTSTRHVPALQRMVAHHINTLPLNPAPEDAPANYLFNLLGCSPSASTELIQENVRCLLQTLHPDKNAAVPAPISRFIPTVKEAKRILLNAELRAVYQCCGLIGIERNQSGLRTCRHCDKFLQSLNDLMDL